MVIGTKSLVSGCALCLLSTSAGADIIFQETFENYNVTGDTNVGVPLLSEGAMQTWYGGRFESPNDGTIDSDIAIRRQPGVFPDQVTYARFEDDAGILFNISTLGYENVSLAFDWLTHNLESGDRFVAGYYVGDIDFTNDTADGAEENLVHRFTTDGPAWSSWTELLRDTNPNSWDTENFALPSNTASIWVAFWLDNGERDYGKVDNVIVTGTVIPAPGALAFLAVCCLTPRRRRSA
jgi:hypothetical protein